MKRLYVIILFSFIFSNFSCKKDWFDVKSNKSLTVPSTPQDFEYLLDNFTVMNQGSVGLPEVGSDGHYIPESQWLSTSITSSEKNAYTWSKELPYNSVGDWIESYKKIFICNLVLDGLAKIASSDISINDNAQYKRVKGNALFHRAKNYFDLAQIYAQPYKKNSASLDLGIPLKEGIDVTASSQRSSVEQTFLQIIADLTTASVLLPAMPELPTRGSKSSCYGLLARTYLVMGDYEKAGQFADASLSIYRTLIDFNIISSTNTNLGRFNAETIFYAQRITTWFSTWFSGFVFVDPNLYALYDDNDLRKTRFFSLANGNITFKGNYNSSAAGFNGIATDEIYLIRAECFARANKLNEAMKDLNDLLRTRWNSSIAFVNRIASNADDALGQILLERKKELLFRNLRWIDLRRLNLEDRLKTTLTRTIGGQTYILEPDSYKYTLPIPDDIIAIAPKIQQAPGW